MPARRHFQGVKLAPFPINDGGEGFSASIVTATGGAARKIAVTSCMLDGRRDAYYGVVSGRTAVIETAQGFSAGGISSIAVGEMLRRALDEGLKSIIIGVHDAQMGDGRQGFARALGVRFFVRTAPSLTLRAIRCRLLNGRRRTISIRAWAK